MECWEGFDGIMSEKMVTLVCRRENRKKSSTAWRVFSLKELHAATNSFNYDNKLGEGAFGSVYWGQLWDGSQVLDRFSWSSLFLDSSHSASQSNVTLSFPFPLLLHPCKAHLLFLSFDKSSSSSSSAVVMPIVASHGFGSPYILLPFPKALSFVLPSASVSTSQGQFAPPSNPL